jgi:hypothetical protein
VNEVTWMRHKREVKDPLAHFGVSGVKGVRGTHNTNCKSRNQKTPFRVKVMVTWSGGSCLVLVHKV